VVAITVAAIGPDTRRIDPALPATAQAIPDTVVLPVIVHPLQPFQVRGIALRLQLFLQAEAIARMPRVSVRGRAGGRRAPCQPMEGTVRIRLRAHDPARMKHAVINVPRPPTPVPRQPHVRMRFPDPREDVPRVRVGTRVLEPRVEAREAHRVVNGANSTRLEQQALDKFTWCDEGAV
jgi:hypothetical protein